MRVVAACGSALLVVAVASATAATAHPGLDPSYGKGGVVHLAGAISPVGAINTYGVAGDGSAYALETVYGCTVSPCGTSDNLLRFRSDGRQDKSFGADGRASLREQSQYAALVADRSGRAVVGEVGNGNILLSRFSPGGAPDGSFGDGGTVELPCGCATTVLKLLAEPDGGFLAIATRDVYSKHFEAIATGVHAFDLLSDGHLDKSFGRAGEAAFKIPKDGELEATVRAPDGTILFGGGECCGEHENVWLWGVTAAGHQAKRFNRAAAGSLHRLGPPAGFPGLTAILPRRGGTVDVIGSMTGKDSFLLRLHDDGKAVASFGRRGVAHLPFQVEAADAGSGGGVFAIIRRGFWHYSVARVLADGKADPAYGGAEGNPLTLPGEGVDVSSLSGGRALVTDLGYFECRSNCPPHPAMARFVE
jgi:hypothetical protein